MFLEATALVFGVLFCLYWYSTRNYSYWKKRRIPYEEPVPIFGNLWDSVIFKRSAGEISQDVYEKYPDEKVVGMYHFDAPVLLLRDPLLVYKVYVTDFHSFEDNSFVVDEDIDPVFGRSVFFQKGEKWKKSRKMLTPAFTIGRIKMIFDRLRAVGEKLNDYIERHPEELELKHLMTRYGTEVSASCVLGIEGHNFEVENPKMVEIGSKIFEPSFVSGIIQFIVLMMPTVSKLFSIKMVPKEVPQFFDDILRNVIEHRQKNSVSQTDIVQHWLDLKKKSEEVAKGNVQSDVVTDVLTNDDVLAGCVTFFTESYETISMTASFALHYLALDKDLQDRLRQEVDDTLESCGGKLTYEAAIEMKLMNNIILEVLRVHPALLHALKNCTKRYEMDIGKAEPLVVEKGTVIVVPNIALSHDPKYWEDPEKFDPDRFDRMDKDEWKKGIFLPFGDGPRMCIGMRLAYAIVKVSLTYILMKYEVVPSPRTPKKFVQDTRHFISRNRDGLWAKFVKRA
ncbi:UNVERIFIED_CONTAM: hypothetical protein PYX00_006177 [Menopon gallinae]|uniref:Cytochrome P450 n=1 Tax=Menopon gallinae TaxID=328185 RepID=A0AAW2HUH3_9NEOP